MKQKRKNKSSWNKIKINQIIVIIKEINLKLPRSWVENIKKQKNLIIKVLKDFLMINKNQKLLIIDKDKYIKRKGKGNFTKVQYQFNVNHHLNHIINYLQNKINYLKVKQEGNY